MSSQRAQGTVRSRLRVLLGAVAAAVALMLWFVLRPEKLVPISPESETPVARNATPASGPLETLPVADLPAPPSPLPAGTFKVYLEPLLYDAPDAQALARVRDHYAAFARGLGSVPGLRLVDDAASADYRVTIQNLDSTGAQLIAASSEWAAKASVEILNGSLGTAGPAGTVYVLGMVGDAWRGRAPDGVVTRGPLSGDCERPTVMPCSPAGIAERQVMALRKKVFPYDESLRRELEARFLNAGLPLRERSMATSDLLSMKMALSEEAIRAVLERVASASGDIDRGNFLALLEGQRRQEVIQPVINVARFDSAESSRMQAVRLLAADYPGDPSVRAALEQIAADSSSPTLQAVTQGLLNGLGDK